MRPAAQRQPRKPRSVISIEGIRPIAPPEQDRQSEEMVAASGTVGCLLFPLDTSDPLLLQADDDPGSNLLEEPAATTPGTTSEDEDITFAAFAAANAVATADAEQQRLDESLSACRICGSRSSKGRPFVRFLPVEHDMAAAKAAPAVQSFTEDIALHIFCGKTASIVSTINRPELEILTNAGLKHKHGIGPEVNAALARTRCAILLEGAPKEKHYYLVREFEAHLAAIRHTETITTTMETQPQSIIGDNDPESSATNHLPTAAATAATTTPNANDSSNPPSSKLNDPKSGVTNHPSLTTPAAAATTLNANDSNQPKSRSKLKPTKPNKQRPTPYDDDDDDDDDDDEDQVPAATPLFTDEESSSSSSSSDCNAAPTLQEEEEEQMVCDRVDGMITYAEERDIMNRIDLDILRGEEQDVLQRILYSIEQSEAVERAKARPSAVSHLVEVGTNSSADERWCLPPTPQKNPGIRFHSNKKCYEDLDQTEAVYQVLHSIPKYIDSQRRRPAFSRGYFQKYVLGVVKEYLREADPLQLMTWKAHIREHPEDPDSYQLDAKGSKTAIAILEHNTEEHIQVQMSNFNQQRTLEDGESLVMDISVPIGERLGGSLKQHTPTSKKFEKLFHGVWVISVKPDGSLVKALSSVKAFGVGCAILAVDGQPCSNPKQFQQLFIQAQLAKEKTPGATTQVTICLPKYSDLSGVDLSKIQPRRRDGAPFDAQYYENMRLDSWAPTEEEEDPQQLQVAEPPKSWIEYPPAGVPAPKPIPKVGNGKSQREEAMKSILNNENSVEVDLIVLAKESLGTVSVCCSDCPGLWLCDFKEGKQLGKLVGENICTGSGAVLLKASGVTISNIEHFKKVKEASKEFDGTFRVTFVFFDGTDLSRVDRSKLVQGRMNPRRRNGQPYPLHLYPAPKQNDLDAGKKKRGRPKKDKSESETPKKARLEETKTSEDSKVESSTQNDGLKLYLDFKNKFKRLIDFEFKDTGVHPASACSSMWTKHKEFFGNSTPCGEKCLCLNKIRKMTRPVLEDYVKAQRKKGGEPVELESLHAKRTGFVLQFFKRFAPLLRAEYKKDTSAELLERLLHMWPIHQRQRMFGTECGENCECLEGWELVFCKGDKDMAEKKKHQPRRRDTFGLSSKKRKLDSNTGVLTSQPPPAGSEAAAPLPKKSKAGTAERRPSQAKRYNFNFDSYYPLGAYFKTVGSKCKVWSIWDNGQVKNDARIQRGTIVDSIIIGTKSHKINTHSDLKRHYDDARRNIFSLDLVFINSEVTASTSPTQYKKDWNFSGNWVGKQLQGWPGGASAKSPESTQKPRPTAAPPPASGMPTSTENSRGNTTGPASGVPTTTENARGNTTGDSQVDDRWTLVEHHNVPAHRTTKPPQSNLKNKLGVINTGGAKEKGKSVNFSKTNEEKFFDKEHKANEYVVRSSQVEDEEKDQSEDLFALRSAEEVFRDAVQNKTCRDLIQVLEHGAASDPKIAMSGLKEQYSKVKDALNAIHVRMKESPSDALKEQQKDLGAKRVLLSVYINATYSIDKALTLRHWQCFEFRLHHIELQKVSSEYVQGRTNVLCGKVTTRIVDAREDLGVLPTKRLTEYISYVDDNGPPVYITTNNSHFLQEKRDFVIEFQEGLNDDLVSPTKLGSFAIPLNRIEEQCPHDGTPVRIVEQVSDSPLLSRGELMVEVRRCRISSDYFERKKQETVAKIRTVIEHITMFKEKEQDASGPLVLSANIMGTGKATVLHAAIQLQVPDIAEKLVDLGANPLEKSNLGTPLSLALNLQYRVQDKLFKAKATENVDTRGHQELFDLYHRITESLRRKINELKSASENTVVAKNSAKPPRGNGALVQPIQAPEATKALPKLDRKEFLVPNKKKICFRYDQPQGCHFGAKCHFAHIQAPLGEKLDGDNFFTADFPDWLNKIEPTVKKDGDWYTAGYYDKSRNVYYYAERLGGQKSHQGVYWYPTAKGAEEAVRRVVLVKATSESRLPSRSSDSSRGEKRSRDKSYYGP